MKLNNRASDRFDWTLAFILLLFLIVSTVAIASAQTTGQYNTNFVPSQIQWYVVGAAIIAVMMYFDPEQYKKAAWIIYGGGVFLLFLLFILPEGMELVARRNNAKSWFHLPGLGSIQPAEFMKTFYIIGAARLITMHNEKHLNRTTQTDLMLLGKIAAVLIVPLFFILKQPDLGTALVFIAITAALVLVSGITWKIIVPLYAGTAALGTLLIWMAVYMQDFLVKTFGFSAYQFARIYSWLDPYTYSSDEGRHLITSLNAIGSGMISGKGFQGREVYVPEAHTDFIFSVIGEDWGFIGASLVISLYFVLIYHLTRTTLQLKDPFSTYVCTGIIAMITFHVFQNIGMTIQLLPITGIPLPLISYGGSSIMGNMLALGLVFSMNFHHRTYMFSADPED
ncbi:FtsW/RodA/SpoVE family cell cycle protein [Bhargavaea beijingensis]|uniref:Rod shape-determining protein RodA n=1 Tax=Bhargavaea beijingensis TaxID=426756 RepID=A0A1G7F7Y1_9BACL|nr:FtsW/RodA/SpoVE family cell cycle protein [Bhargavaea beijingensis]MCW1927675.1 rod shape-determining protein RodA [Bhargavaea beijingensis]RSK33337.1 rod shape-determining protein RodA [Bhargavaea beijingensis]SDE72002.1 rod shape determining protein RodA [Bhargavaea beijingensis]